MLRDVRVTYDFDMFSVIPKETQRKFSGLFSMFGMTEQARQQVAMFRDPETAAALNGASHEVQACFFASGFALNGYHCRTEEGRYAAADEDGRADVLARLEKNLAMLSADADWNGFDIDAFFAISGAAVPLNEVASFSAQKLLDTAQPLAERVTSRRLSAPAPSF